MSFINKAKNEIASSPLTEKCCIISELSALVNSIGKISQEGENFTVTIDTEIQSLPRRIEQMMMMLYNYTPKTVQYEDTTFLPVTKFKITIDGEIAKQMLLDIYVMRDRGFGNYEYIKGISRYVVEKECDIRSYIRGIFLACASANIKIANLNEVKKHRGGYHLEFVFSKQNLSKDFVVLMQTLSFNLKVMPRKNNYVCYIKEMEIISDILAIVGANKAVLTLQNELAFRNVRNNLNRQLNCLNANIGKTIDASMKQLNAINLIDETVGIESLPDNLLELCLLRLANPEENFEELRKLSSPQLTKSCINHRFRKIMEIASAIEKELQNDNGENQSLQTEIKIEDSEE